jgi:hypothetical protein
MLSAFEVLLLGKFIEILKFRKDVLLRGQGILTLRKDFELLLNMVRTFLPVKAIDVLNSEIIRSDSRLNKFIDSLKNNQLTPAIGVVRLDDLIKVVFPEIDNERLQKWLNFHKQQLRPTRSIDTEEQHIFQRTMNIQITGKTFPPIRNHENVNDNMNKGAPEDIDFDKGPLLNSFLIATKVQAIKAKSKIDRLLSSIEKIDRKREEKLQEVCDLRSWFESLEEKRGIVDKNIQKSSEKDDESKELFRKVPTKKERPHKEVTRNFLTPKLEITCIPNISRSPSLKRAVSAGMSQLSSAEKAAALSRRASMLFEVIKPGTAVRTDSFDLRWERKRLRSESAQFRKQINSMDVFELGIIRMNRKP